MRNQNFARPWILLVGACALGATSCRSSDGAASTKSESAYVTTQPKLATLAAVVKKDGRCALAAAIALRPEFPGASAFQPHDVVCVGDITLEANTLREKHGCGAFYLDLNTLLAKPLMGTQADYDVSPKACNSGGFEEVITKVESGRFSPVFFQGHSHHTVVIYSTENRFREWFEKGQKDSK